MGNDAPILAQPESGQPIKIGFWKGIFHHPNFNAICGIVTIASLLFAVWSWWINIKMRNLTYYVSAVRTPIVQKGGLNDFAVTLNGQEIRGNLSSAEIQLWNQGREPIFSQDVFKSVTIRTESNQPIYKISVIPSRDIIAPVLNTTNQASGIVQLDWKVLEKDDGLKVQLIYGGDVNVPFIVDGVLQGQKHLSFFGEHKSSDTTNRKLIMVLVLILATVQTIFYTVILAFVRPFLRTEPIKRKTVRAMIVYATVVGVILAFALYHVFLDAYSKPPFGL